MSITNINEVQMSQVNWSQFIKDLENIKKDSDFIPLFNEIDKFLTRVDNDKITHAITTFKIGSEDVRCVIAHTFLTALLKKKTSLNSAKSKKASVAKNTEVFKNPYGQSNAVKYQNQMTNNIIYSNADDDVHNIHHKSHNLSNANPYQNKDNSPLNLIQKFDSVGSDLLRDLTLKSTESSGTTPKTVELDKDGINF